MELVIVRTKDPPDAQTVSNKAEMVVHVLKLCSCVNVSLVLLFHKEDNFKQEFNQFFFV